MTRPFFAGSIDSRARRPGRVERWCLALAVAMGLGFTPIASAQTFDLTAATIKNLNLAFDDGTLTSERLVDLYLARIAAYDKVGPKLNAVLALNINAVETARALDVERKVNGPRSLLHGTPVVLKDNIDTTDLPTTAGSILLKGSIPPDDAFIKARQSPERRSVKHADDAAGKL